MLGFSFDSCERSDLLGLKCGKTDLRVGTIIKHQLLILNVRLKLEFKSRCVALSIRTRIGAKKEIKGRNSDFTKIDFLGGRFREVSFSGGQFLGGLCHGALLQALKTIISSHLPCATL